MKNHIIPKDVNSFGTKKSALEMRDEEKAHRKIQTLDHDHDRNIPMHYSSEEAKLVEGKLSHEEKERRTMQRAADLKYDNHTHWMRNLVSRTLDDPLKVNLLSKIIDMKPIDGNSL